MSERSPLDKLSKFIPSRWKSLLGVLAVVLAISNIPTTSASRPNNVYLPLLRNPNIVNLTCFEQNVSPSTLNGQPILHADIVCVANMSTSVISNYTSFGALITIFGPEPQYQFFPQPVVTIGPDINGVISFQGASGVAFGDQPQTPPCYNAALVAFNLSTGQPAVLGQVERRVFPSQSDNC